MDRKVRQRSMIRYAQRVVAAVIMVCLTPSSVIADIDAATVERSIARGVDYLRKSQNGRGGWQEHGGQSCGLSALCTLAMANAGVSPDDPDFVEAMRYLRKFEPRQTYSIALQTLVFCHVGAVQDLPRIRQNVNRLISDQKPPESRWPGAWGYDKDRGNGDPSNAQFAILALGAATERGVNVDPKVFEAATKYWKDTQLPQGGWSYSFNANRASGSMTCAGIGSLIICADSLSDLHEGLGNANQPECCQEDERDRAIERGLEYLGQKLSLQANPGSELKSYYYYLYAVERVGRLSGRRILGNRDWYREGAERLVSLQDHFEGYWQGGGPIESNRDIATSFALLFLSKGKRQVAMGRLTHPCLLSESSVPPDRKRNQGRVSVQRMPHVGAVRQLIRHVQRDWSKDLTWQTIEAENASLEDLLQSPVLLVSGDRSLAFSADLVERLGEYLDQGGTILFDANECGDPLAFKNSVVRICRQWYPDASLEKLPVSHPVWFAERPASPLDLGENYWVYGLGACCRTPVFFSPTSLTCRWTYGGLLFRGASMNPILQKQVVAAVTIGENILAYATGRELKDKLDDTMIVDGNQAPVPTRGAIPIAAGALGAGEEQVRRALPNAASIIRDRLAVEVLSIDQPIELTDASLARVGALILHGRTEFQLTPRATEALARYLRREGIVIATSICGSEAFTQSVKSVLEALVTDGRFRPMPPGHPALTSRFNGYDLSRVEIRRPLARPTSPRDPVRVSRRQGTPLVEVMSVGDVDTVFFSPLDLSCALESQNSIQCPGYSTSDAAKILSNLILYALNQ